MPMNPDEFEWALYMLRRRAKELGPQDKLWDVVLDGEALLKGEETVWSREKVIAAVTSAIQP
jgi:hypothetical protein